MTARSTIAAIWHDLCQDFLGLVYPPPAPPRPPTAQEQIARELGRIADALEKSSAPITVTSSPNVDVHRTSGVRSYGQGMR